MHMYKVIFKTGFFLAVLLTGLTSCGDISQDLKINADGSGVLETTFDIGEMMGMMKGLQGAGLNDVTVEDEPSFDINLSDPASPAEPVDPMQSVLDMVTDPSYTRDFDTLFSFLSIMPDSVREKETRPDLAKKLSLRIKSPARSSNVTFGIVMQYDSEAHLRELVDYMDKMDEGSAGGVMAAAGPGGLQSESFLVYTSNLKEGWIRFDTVDYGGIAGEMGMSGDSSVMSSEDLGMMEMMFGSSKIKSVIHVPGEVTSCTHPDAILTKDNRVILEFGFMDILRKGKLDGYTIYFTPKK